MTNYSSQNVGSFYWDHPYYKTQEYRDSLEAAKRIEQKRQDLVAKMPTKCALAYARFLLAVEDDATINGGAFRSPSQEKLLRDYPFLAEVLEMEND